MNFIQRTIPVGAFQCNCQILTDASTGRTVIVDPGDQSDLISKALADIAREIQKPIQVECLFHTHAHFDHFGATRDLREGACADAKICLHQDDALIYSKLVDQGKMFGFEYREPLAVDRFLKDEETLVVGAMKFSMIHTPGHSPGGLSYRLHEDSAHGIPEIVFSGDTLFRESVGRTDLWGGDAAVLKKSIQTRLFVLDADTLVWPGHGPQTTIGFEKSQNPYVGI